MNVAGYRHSPVGQGGKMFKVEGGMTELLVMVDEGAIGSYGGLLSAVNSQARYGFCIIQI